MHHYTDKVGYGGIRSTVTWIFKANRPPVEHPFGAYFTTLGPGTKNLALKLRIPKLKIDYVFIFIDFGDLRPLRGGRGDFVFYAPGDYEVEKSRQIVCGERPIVGARGGTGGEKHEHRRKGHRPRGSP